MGDRVLVANRSERGKRKVSDKWESTVYEVMSVKPDVNVYYIKDPITAKTKVVHRNLLLPVNFLTAAKDSDHSLCPSNAESDLSDRVVSDEILDSETKTVTWLLQTGDLSCEADAGIQCEDASDNPVCASLDDDHLLVPKDVTKDMTGLNPLVSAAVPRSADSVYLSPAGVTSEAVEHNLSTEPNNETLLESPKVQVVCTQPPGLCTRSGRPVKPPARLICEMNEQVVTDPIPTVGSVFSFVKSMFSG